MRRLALTLFVALIFPLITAGCAGFGIAASSNPDTKLDDADHLFKQQNRPLPAERLINEAIAIYQERNDPRGLGLAYREYAEFLRSPAVQKWEHAYRKYGFHDKSITFDNRIAKSDEFLERSISYFKNAEKQYDEQKKYDALTNVYFNMGITYLMLKNRTGACISFDKALNAYSENIRSNPGAKPISTPGTTIPSTMADAKKAAGCN